MRMNDVYVHESFAGDVNRTSKTFVLMHQDHTSVCNQISRKLLHNTHLEIYLKAAQHGARQHGTQRRFLTCSHPRSPYQESSSSPPTSDPPQPSHPLPQHLPRTSPSPSPCP